MRRKDPDAPYWVATRNFQKRMIENALRSVGARADIAARALGIEKSYLFRKIREFGIDRAACADPNYESEA